MVFEDEEVSQVTRSVCLGKDADVDSELLKDLLDLAPSQSNEIAPIFLHQTSDIVRHFIDHVTSANAHETKLDAADYKHILDLCDHLRAPTIELSIIQNLKLRVNRVTHCDIDPLAIFKLAASRNDFMLARSAIGAFDGAGTTVSTMLLTTPPAFDDVSPRYLYAVVRYFVEVTDSCGGHTNLYVRRAPAAEQLFTLELLGQS